MPQEVISSGLMPPDLSNRKHPGFRVVCELQAGWSLRMGGLQPQLWRTRTALCRTVCSLPHLNGYPMGRRLSPTRRRPLACDARLA